MFRSRAQNNDGGSSPCSLALATGEAPQRRRAVSVHEGPNLQQGVPFTALVSKTAHECACSEKGFLSEKAG